MWRELLANSLEEAKVAVFGVTVDENCSIESGASKAPKVIRDCSQFLPPVTTNGEKILPTLYDLGDVKKFDYEQVKLKINQINNKKFTLILGGDHSISILTQKAYKELAGEKVGIIHIDAHADICDVYDGKKNSHACVNRRALENGYSVEDISMIGIRSYEVQELEYLKNNNITIVKANEVGIYGLDMIVNGLINKYQNYNNIYLSFDIDAVDPSYAPGTGTPEAFGLTSVEVLQLITKIIELLPVKIMDIVEVSPPLDCNNITTWLALKYILEIINIVNSKGEKTWQKEN